jgi:hypothetical protein
MFSLDTSFILKKYSRGYQMTRTLLIVALLSLAGCAANKPAFIIAPKPEGNNALVYLYRSNADTNGDVRADFYLDNVNVANLERNEYTWMHIPAGKYVLHQKWAGDSADNQKVSVVMQAGNVYYYRLATSILNHNVQWFIGSAMPRQMISPLREAKFMPSLPFEQAALKKQ